MWQAIAVVSCRRMSRDDRLFRLICGPRGLELWDKGQSPHYDLVYLRGADADGLLDAVVATHSTALINPHYDPDGGADR
jgi:hypothetical protein